MSGETSFLNDRSSNQIDTVVALRNVLSILDRAYSETEYDNSECMDMAYDIFHLASYKAIEECARLNRRFTRVYENSLARRLGRPLRKRVTSIAKHSPCS